MVSNQTDLANFTISSRVAVAVHELVDPNYQPLQVSKSVPLVVMVSPDPILVKNFLHDVDIVISCQSAVHFLWRVSD